MATRKAGSKIARGRKSPTPKRARGKLAPGASARGLDAADVVIAMDSAEIADVVGLIRSSGGALIGSYRDPLGGRPLVLARQDDRLHAREDLPRPVARDLRAGTVREGLEDGQQLHPLVECELGHLIDA